MEIDSQTVLTRFSKRLKLGDVVTPIEGSTQTFMVVEVFEATARGYEVEDYMLRLVTDDKSQEPETIIFKVGTQWQKVDPSYIKGRTKLRVVSKRKKYYEK